MAALVLLQYLCHGHLVLQQVLLGKRLLQLQLLIRLGPQMTHVQYFHSTLCSDL